MCFPILTLLFLWRIIKESYETLTKDGKATFQTFPDQKGQGRQLYPHVLHGTLEEHIETLTTLNKATAGIYIMVNEGNLKGRSAKNVVRVRALFADFDGVPLPEMWVLEPSIIVESSQGKYHTYWLLADTLPFDDFKPLQKAIAEIFGSDNKVCDLPRVMRLPAFYHQKSEPFLTRLIKCDGELRYKASQLKETFPVRKVNLKPNPVHPVTFESTSDNARKYAQKALANEYDLVASAPKGNRNHTLNKAAFSLGQLVAGGLLHSQEVENVLLKAGLICGLSQGETKTTLNSGLKAGVLNPRYPKPLEKRDLTSARLGDIGEGSRRFLATPPITNIPYKTRLYKRKKQIKARYVKKEVNNRAL